MTPNTLNFSKILNTLQSLDTTKGYIQQIHKKFDEKAFTPLDIAHYFISAIQQEPWNCYLTLCEATALHTAEQQTKILQKESLKSLLVQYPLFGIPVGIKDNIFVKGIKNTCASKVLENYIAPFSATAVENLEKAGAIVLGKLNLDEFAMGSTCENSAFGPTLNPHDPLRAPGGSSGGSAAAVAGDLCIASLGSDTGGSIRLPASYCGVVGLKPTYGSVSRHGLVAFASSLDQIGPFAKTIADVTQIFDVITGNDGKDMTIHPEPAKKCFEQMQKPVLWKDLTVAFLNYDHDYAHLSPDMQAAYDNLQAFFIKQGAKVLKRSLPHAQHAVSIYYLIAVSEASSNLSRFDGLRYGTQHGDITSDSLEAFYAKNRSLFGHEVKKRILLGTFILNHEHHDEFYTKACQVRRLIADDFDKIFDEADLIISPISTAPAPLLNNQMHSLSMYLNDVFTIPINFAGLPSISIPIQKTPQGLPMGMQFIAKAYQEASLLQWAYHFQNLFSQEGQA